MPCYILIHRAVVRGGAAGAPEFGVSKKRTALWEENKGTTNYSWMDGDFCSGILSFFSWSKRNIKKNGIHKQPKPICTKAYTLFAAAAYSIFFRLNKKS